jgi:hypothetical protein
VDLTCALEGCEKPRKYRSTCMMHYWRMRKYGSYADPRPTVDERFWSKVDKTGDCWMWLGKKQSTGHGHFVIVKGLTVMAYRYSYEQLVGPIPAGLVIDHLCRTPPCVNPAHLEPVTSGENLRRGDGPTGRRFRQTHCIHGHEFTPENTERSGPYQTRRCRACRRARA